MQVAMIATAVAGAASAYTQYQGGKAAEADAKRQAQVEGIKAREEAIGRRERLIKALAHQNAKVGSSGITHSGSPTSVMLEDISEFEREDEARNIMGSARRDQMRTAGRNAAWAGRAQAGISLLNTTAKAASTYGQG